MIAVIITQVILFILGCILIAVDSGGYKSDATWVSGVGIGLCLLGIGLIFIKGGIQILIQKIKKSK